jgi:hypothetical protein
MTRIALLFTGVAVLLVALLPAETGHAQDAYISSTGGGTACTRSSPCAGWAAALAAVIVGGTIYCLDPASYNANGVPITKSITVDCAGGLNQETNGGFVINGPGIVVRLRNLTLNGFGYNSPGNGTVGIDFKNGSALYLENVNIAGFQSSPAIGVRLEPTASSSKLVIINSLISDNGVGSVGGGIVISPQSSGSARVLLERVTVANNVFGIAVDGSGSTGGINMTIVGSDVAGNSQDGIIATTPSGGAPIGIYVKSSRSANNTFGIRSLGANVTVRVDGSGVVGNNTGLAFGGGGALLSAGNNMVRANGTDGAFSGPVALQ